MLRRIKRWISLSDGERSIVLAYIGVALFGAGLSFTVVNNLGGEDTILRTLTPYDYWVILSGALGAAVGLYFGGKWFGRAGWAGLRHGAVGLCVTTFAASVAAGTFALPGYGTMFGPFAAVLTFLESPLLLVFWVSILTACHLLFATWRRERDTLFAIHDDGIPT
ncbi:hypothetical protein AB3Y40_10105 [Yoonia sp. R2331]|uniref:hypothetical protein n=1 Tax=Yoonia sp. R2331 TaxID=3237238 RepID=UPI0034E474CC